MLKSARNLLVPLMLAVAATPATAAMLEPQLCTDLKVELTLLQGKGVALDMAKGPEWGKANLPRDRLKEIERLIHVEEQLAFRCPQPKKPPAAGEDEDGPAAATQAKATKPGQARAAAKPASSEAEEAKPKPKKPPAKAAAAPAQGADEAPPPRKPPPAAKPKPKVDDAFSPAAAAAGSPGGNPAFKGN